MITRLLWFLVLVLLSAGCGSSDSGNWNCNVTCAGGPQQTFTVNATDANAACTQALSQAGCGVSFTCNCTSG